MSSWRSSLAVLAFCHLAVDLCVGIWPVYKTLAHIDLALAGALLGAAGFIGDSFQLFFGYLGDRGYRKRMILLGIVMATSALGFIFVTGAFFLFCTLLAVYLGSGFFHPMAAGAAQDLLPERKGFAMAFFAAGGAFGFAMAQLFFSYFYQQGNLVPLLTFFFPLLGLIILTRTKLPEARVPREKFTLGGLTEHRRALTMLYFSQLLVTSAFYGFIFFLPDILSLQGQKSWICLGGGHCLMALGNFALVIPLGMLADRVGHRYVLVGLASLATLALYLFLLSGPSSLLWLISFLMLFGVTAGSFSPIGVALGGRLAPERLSSVSALLMGGVWSFSHLLGPGCGGLLTKIFPENGILFAVGTLGLLLPLAALLVSFATYQESALPTEATIES